MSQLVCYTESTVRGFLVRAQIYETQCDLNNENNRFAEVVK